jgi:PAS domain S-box-containing protein
MAAIFCDAIADFGYSYQTLENTYFGGQWPDCLYMLAFVLITFSAHYQYLNAETLDYKKQDEASQTLPSSWLPYAAVAGTYTLILYVTYKHEPTIGSASIIWLTIGAFLLTILVAVRQMLALRENSRLLAEKASRESEMRLAALIQHSSDVITIIGRDGAVLYMSPSTERMFGFRAQKFLGSQLSEYIHPQDEQRMMDSLSIIAEQPRKTISLELRARHREGHWIHLESVITNLLHEPSIAGIVINSRDVTERKKAERALHDGREKLRQVQKMESLGQLATSVGYDFSNLVEVIIGYAELLLRRQRSDEDEDTIHWLKEIQDAGRRAKTLTNQLLAFSIYLPRNENSDGLVGLEADSNGVDDGSDTVLLVEGDDAVRLVS